MPAQVHYLPETVFPELNLAQIHGGVYRQFVQRYRSAEPHYVLILNKWVYVQSVFILWEAVWQTYLALFRIKVIPF